MIDACVTGAVVRGPTVAVRAPWPALPLLAAIALAACALTLASPHPSATAVLLLVTPLIEEACFRAGMQECLLRNRFSPWCANLTTALAFTLAHCIWRGVELVSVAVLIPALVLGWTYSRFRSLRLCIALHMLMNIVWVESGRWALQLFRSL